MQDLNPFSLAQTSSTYLALALVMLGRIVYRHGNYLLIPPICDQYCVSRLLVLYYIALLIPFESEGADS